MHDSNARAPDGWRKAQALRSLLAACFALSLAACQAAAPPSEARSVLASPATATSPAESAPDRDDVSRNGMAATPASPRSDVASAKTEAPTRGAQETAATPPPAAPGRDGVLEDRCGTDADCEVKDVGSCCGYRPQCLHRDSPTFADEVKARCKAEGRVGHCGIAAVAGCACQAGRCVNVESTDNALVQ